MKQEIATAAVFFSQLLQKDNDASRIAKFTQLLTDALAARYASHWHKDMPHVGSGYRCLRSSHKGLDPVLRRAVEGSNVVVPSNLTSITVWIDPEEVSFRCGEQGTICHIPLQHVGMPGNAQQAGHKMGAALRDVMVHA